MAEESRFAKIARVGVVQSAASVITFNEFQTGVGLQVGATRGKGMAMLVDQLDYYLPALAAAIVADGDTVRYAITTSNQVTGLEDFDDQRILHMGERIFKLTTSGMQELKQPHTFQFFPALIWAEPTLFAAVDGAAQPTAAEVNIRIYYRLVELDQQLVFEIAQQFRIIS